MARPRHAMRVHPLRSKSVVVGVPVAAAVAFGAHSVLGVTPLSDQQDVPPAASAAPTAAPVQSYGLATTPPPTTLDLLSAPGDQAAPTGAAAPSASSAPSAASAAAPAKSTTRIVADRAPVGPTRTVPIAAPAPAAAAPAPSMMTFSGGEAPQQSAAAPQQQAAQQQAAQQQAAPQQQTADTGAQQSSGGSLLGLDLGVAKVSVLSFGQ